MYVNIQYILVVRVCLKDIYELNSYLDETLHHDVFLAHQSEPFASYTRRSARIAAGERVLEIHECLLIISAFAELLGGSENRAHAFGQLLHLRSERREMLCREADVK